MVAAPNGTSGGAPDASGTSCDTPVVLVPLLISFGDSRSPVPGVVGCWVRPHAVHLDALAAMLHRLVLEAVVPLAMGVLEICRCVCHTGHATRRRTKGSHCNAGAVVIVRSPTSTTRIRCRLVPRRCRSALLGVLSQPAAVHVEPDLRGPAANARPVDRYSSIAPPRQVRSRSDGTLWRVAVGTSDHSHPQGLTTYLWQAIGGREGQGGRWATRCAGRPAKPAGEGSSPNVPASIVGRRIWCSLRWTKVDEGGRRRRDG